MDSSQLSQLSLHSEMSDQSTDQVESTRSVKVGRQVKRMNASRSKHHHKARSRITDFQTMISAKVIRDFREVKTNTRIKDPVYDYVEIPSSIQPFVDTIEFQRLEDIKQLGVSFKVYPSGTHTRKEHSLGVMHLAGKVVKRLRHFVEIDDRVKELIQLGGLYHDIGHMSYSHLFDSFIKTVVLPRSIDPNAPMVSEELITYVDPDDPLIPFLKIKDHEDRSVYILRSVNERLKLLTPDEEDFVCNVILGKTEKGKKTDYLYQIVNNRRCGVDVDKMDYLYRDAYHLKMPSFQSKYIISCMIITADGTLAFKNKAKPDIKSMFDTRKKMFQEVYFHPTVQKIERIYKCAFKRLGMDLFQYGFLTDDVLIGALLKTHESTKRLMYELNEGRGVNHECEKCEMYEVNRTVKPSGQMKDVVFVR